MDSRRRDVNCEDVDSCALREHGSSDDIRGSGRSDCLGHGVHVRTEGANDSLGGGYNTSKGGISNQRGGRNV